MTAARTGHTATALGAHDGAQNGDVLIVGIDGSTDLYDPNTQQFTAAGELLPKYFGRYSRAHREFTQRWDRAGDGRCLSEIGIHHSDRRGYQSACVPGGTYPQSTAVAALFAPESDGFTQTASLNTSRDGHTATVLPDGAVLVVGGTQHTNASYRFRCAPYPRNSATPLASAELFK